MSLSPVVRRTLARASHAVASLTAAAALAPGLAPLHAQPAVVGADVNAAAETGATRAPLFFAGAGLAPRGRVGLSLQAVGVTQEVTYDGTSGPASYSTEGILTTASAFWAPVSRLTLGAYLTIASADDPPTAPIVTQPSAASVGLVSRHVAAQVVEPTPDGPPTRQGTRTGINSNELGLHARLGLWRSATGATQVTATGRLLDRTDAAVAGSAGVALQQRAGRVTLHAAPSAWFSDNAQTSWELNGGAALAVAARTALTGELLHLRSASNLLGTRSLTEVAGGVRHRFGALAIDVGVRHLVGYTQPVREASRTGALLATHWSF